MILFCIKVGIWIKKKTAKMRPSIGKGGLIIVSLLVRHRPVLSHAKQSDNSLFKILAPIGDYFFPPYLCLPTP